MNEEEREIEVEEIDDEERDDEVDDHLAVEEADAVEGCLRPPSPGSGEGPRGDVDNPIGEFH